MAINDLLQLVRPGGIEPPAFGTGIRRSIQLNYGRKLLLLKERNLGFKYTDSL